MRAVVLLSGLPPGGAERMACTLVERLAARGRPVPLVTLTRRHDGPLARELAERGVRREDLGLRRLADPRGPLRLAALLRRERAELVHAHGQDAAILAAVTGAVTGVRLVVTRHVLEEPAASWRQDLRARAALHAFRRARPPVAVSRAAAERLERLARLPAGAVRVAWNGVDVERIAAAAPARERVRADLGVDAGTALVLALAVLRRGKGHDLLLDAMPRILASRPRTVLAVAGGGELAGAIADRARPLGAAVRLLGHRDDVPELLAASDLVVLASEAEALPMALIEAGAAGRAVVATRVGGVPEVVEDGRTGLLVEPGRSGELADAAVALLSDAGRRARMGEAARSRAASLFSLDAHVDATLAIWAGAP